MNGEGTSDIVAALLARRNVTAEEADRFLNPDFARDLHDPFLLPDMDRAVDRILAAMEAGEKIAVYGDFDCDGIPGTALLAEAFRKIGYPVDTYVPHRDREGYGFHAAAIDELAGRGARLIITVDVGTVAFDGVAHATERGIDVIVTDHHELQEKLPACILINPKRAGYPFGELCGTATAWKLATALFAEGRRRALPAFAGIPEGWEKWLLDLVAIATVADMVPLVGENRVLAHFGIMVLRKSARQGLRALATSARIRQAFMTEDDIGFSVAPRINAASRMGEPELALRLLLTDDAAEAQNLARELESLNRKRRGVVASMVREARSRISARFGPEESVVVIGDTAWKPSLCGLAANAIMEERGGVVCVWGRDAHGRLRGSARSDGSVSVVELFGAAGDSLEEFGGHHASGGFSVSHEAVHGLQETLAAAAGTLKAREVVEAEPDGEILLGDVSAGFFRDLSRLAPFGKGNPKPLFRVRRARITSARRFGKDMNHTEVMLVCSETGATCRAFQFFRAPSDFTVPAVPDTAVDLLATIERDAFRGPDRLALRLADILVPRSGGVL